MREEEIVEKVKERFGDQVIEAKILRDRRVSIKTAPEAYKDVVKYVAYDLGLRFLGCVTGIDAGESFEVVAHIGFSTSVLVRTSLPKSRPEIDSITDILPAASLYEREIHDLIGITFKGHPSLKRFILPEEWPEGLYPLRKDYSPKHPEPLRGGRSR